MNLVAEKFNIEQASTEEILDVHELLSVARGARVYDHPEYAEEDLKEYKIWVEGIKDNPLGFEVLREEESGEIVAAAHATYFESSKVAKLNALAVKPEVRKRGVGKKAIDIFMRSAKELDCQKVSLDVSKRNEPAKNLYEKAGFQVDDNSAGVSHVTMVKDLQ